jgi:hypothetical protein
MPWSLDSYEEFVYRIRDYSPHIGFSTLVLQRRGKLAGVLKGEIVFAKDITLTIFENLNFLTPEGKFIVDYGYEVKNGDATQYWYDSQPHPNDPTLQITHPHHKHIPPDIKHHRIPAPGLSFNAPNLPFLIQEIENLFFNTGET